MNVNLVHTGVTQIHIHPADRGLGSRPMGLAAARRRA
jgi:hypothetical protein